MSDMTFEAAVTDSGLDLNNQNSAQGRLLVRWKKRGVEPRFYDHTDFSLNCSVFDTEWAIVGTYSSGGGTLNATYNEQSGSLSLSMSSPDRNAWAVSAFSTEFYAKIANDRKGILIRCDVSISTTNINNYFLEPGSRLLVFMP